MLLSGAFENARHTSKMPQLSGKLEEEEGGPGERLVLSTPPGLGTEACNEGTTK